MEAVIYLQPNRLPADTSLVTPPSWERKGWISLHSSIHKPRFPTSHFLSRWASESCFSVSFPSQPRFCSWLQQTKCFFYFSTAFQYISFFIVLQGWMVDGLQLFSAFFLVYWPFKMFYNTCQHALIPWPTAQSSGAVQGSVSCMQTRGVGNRSTDAPDKKMMLYLLRNIHPEWLMHLSGSAGFATVSHLLFIDSLNHLVISIPPHIYQEWLEIRVMEHHYDPDSTSGLELFIVDTVGSTCTWKHAHRHGLNQSRICTEALFLIKPGMETRPVNPQIWVILCLCMGIYSTYQPWWQINKET